MPISILRAGNFVDARGRPVSYSVPDLKAIAESYDAQAAPAPLVIGHPATNDPAYGWVTSLCVEGDTLFATLDQVDDSLRQANQDGRYTRVSSSVFPAGHPANPRPGGPYLRHVGLLGGAAPAVASLPPVQLAGDDDVPVIDACDLAADAFPADPDAPREEPEEREATELAAGDMRQSLAEKDALIAQMADQLAALRDRNVNFEAENARLLADKHRSEAQTYVDALVEQARVPPSLSAQTVDLLVAAGRLEPVELSSGDSVDLAGGLRALLEALPPVLSVNELSAAHGAPAVLDADALAAQARAIVNAAAARGERMSVAEAVTSLTRKG